MSVILEFITLLIWGLCIGSFVSAGVCALLTSVGIITRVAWVTKTTNRIRCYENCILIGAAGSNIIYICQPEIFINSAVSQVILAVMGIFFGVFVGCLAMSLAEALDGSAILFRRIRLKSNFKYIILAIAIGKFIGNILYYYY